jgi:hypothetical protein
VVQSKFLAALAQLSDISPELASLLLLFWYDFGQQ